MKKKVWKHLDAGIPIIILLYDTMKGASLEEMFVLLAFFTSLNHGILNPTLGFKSYLNIARNSSARMLRIQPISVTQCCMTRQQVSRESPVKFLKAGVSFGPDLSWFPNSGQFFYWSIPTPSHVTDFVPQFL